MTTPCPHGATERDWSLALQSLTPGGSEFQSPEACVAYVRERLHHGQDLAKEGVRLKREVARLRGELSRTAVREGEVRGVLGQMEFIDTATAQGHQPVCARCGGWKRKEGHRPGCDLAWCLATASPLADAAQEVLEAAVEVRVQRVRWMNSNDEDDHLFVGAFVPALLRFDDAVDRYRALLEGRTPEEKTKLDLFECMEQWRQEDTEEDVDYMRQLLREMNEGRTREED